MLFLELEDDGTYNMCKNILQSCKTYASAPVSVFVCLIDCLFIEAHFLAPPENSYPTSIISTFLQVYLTD